MPDPSVSQSGWQTHIVTTTGDAGRQAPLRRGFILEYATLGWNVAGIVVLAIAAITARSVALAGFGLGSLIEIGASAVVIWELSGTGERRQRRALRLIGSAFAALAVYLLVPSTVVLAAGYRPRHSALAIAVFAVLAAAVLAGLVLNAAVGLWRDDPAAGYVLVYDAAREVREIFTGHHWDR